MKLSREMLISKYESRIALLSERPKDNSNIVRKLQRQLRKFKSQEA